MTYSFELEQYYGENKNYVCISLKSDNKRYRRNGWGEKKGKKTTERDEGGSSAFKYAHWNFTTREIGSTIITFINQTDTNYGGKTLEALRGRNGGIVRSSRFIPQLVELGPMTAAGSKY